MEEIDDQGNPQQDFVILVDEDNRAIGQIAKMEAHIRPLLHRAFSVLIFNTDGQLLIQQRALTKYHSPGKWSNSCCSHPRPGEATQQAADRRLMEELGFDAQLQEEFSFVYKFQDEDSGLWEHEHDTVFTGTYEGEIPFNAEEIMAVKWVEQEEMDRLLLEEPKTLTFWFKILWKRYREELTLN